MPPPTSAQTTKTFRRSEQGFDVFGLRNEAVELALVPELGAKVILLRNLVTGYEWMWHPPTGMKLFRNQLGDDFAASTMTGSPTSRRAQCVRLYSSGRRPPRSQRRTS